MQGRVGGMPIGALGHLRPECVVPAWIIGLRQQGPPPQLSLHPVLLSQPCCGPVAPCPPPPHHPQRRVTTRPFAASCPTFDIPSTTAIDLKLLAGGALFGAGWGLSGMCPGPAIASVATGAPQVLAYVAAMAVGMVLQQQVAAKVAAPALALQRP